MPSLSKNIYTSWSPDGKYLGVGNQSDVLAVFDINSGKIAKKVQFYIKSMSSLSRPIVIISLLRQNPGKFNCYGRYGNNQLDE